MDISWLGHSCFRIKGKEVVLLTDPYHESIGYAWPRPSADIVTVSHGHEGHSNASGAEGNPKVVSRPGEYEVRGVFIIGLATFHDAEEGNVRGRNTAYLIEMDDIRLCHLGDIGHVPSSRHVQELSGVDVLFTPVGGVSTIDAKATTETIRLISPRVVIPMHYQTEVVTWLEPLSRFTAEMGLGEVAPQPRLSLTRSNLPSDGTKVMVLERS
jgi:L-ascorbate metabolism protein UlaG (beta-lactamase superfamily)